MWLKPDLIGPQKGSSSIARLKAQAKHVEVERREALEVRIQWMTLLGLPQEEIDENKYIDLFSLEDELFQLSSVMELR